MHPFRRCLLLIPILVVVQGCSSTPEKPQPRVVNPMGLSGQLVPEAERTYSQARVLWRENFVLRAKDGEVCRNPQKAVELLNRTITLEPEYTPAYVRRGMAYSDLKQFDAAFADLSTAIELNPTAEHYATRALVSLKAGKKEKAQRDIKRALKADENKPVVWNTKALLEFADTNTEGACESLEKACSLGDCSRRNAARAEGLCP